MVLSQREKSPTPKTAEDGGIGGLIFSAKRKKRKRPRRGRIIHTPGDGLPDQMTTEQLRSPTALAKLYEQYCGTLPVQDFFALAVRAVRKGRNPPAAFRWMLANQAAYQITVEEDRQAARMRRKAGEQRRFLPEVKALVERLRLRIRWRPPTEQELNARRNAVLDYLESLDDASA